MSITIKNTGSRDGAEVVQVYVSPIKPRINRPVKELKAFQKVFLKAQESRTVDIKIDVVRSTSFWDEHAEKWCSDAGKYKLLVGNSGAADASFVEAELLVAKTTYWTGL